EDLVLVRTEAADSVPSMTGTGA
ncbi:MAG: hypothetical protein JWO75_3660, partial [Actinomycetia bacterium]|nr:hypothetical protein [Actinomycetes bacterium]